MDIEKVKTADSSDDTLQQSDSESSDSSALADDADLYQSGTGKTLVPV